MMEELRQIREEIGQTTSLMTCEEKIRFFSEGAQIAAVSIGRELKPHPTIPNAWLMIPELDSGKNSCKNS
jgi:hypothetical protein